MTRPRSSLTIPHDLFLRIARRVIRREPLADLQAAAVKAAVSRVTRGEDYERRREVVELSVEKAVLGKGEYPPVEEAMARDFERVERDQEPLEDDHLDASSCCIYIIEVLDFYDSSRGQKHTHREEVSDYIDRCEKLEHLADQMLEVGSPPELFFGSGDPKGSPFVSRLEHLRWVWRHEANRVREKAEPRKSGPLPALLSFDAARALLETAGLSENAAREILKGR